MFALISFIIVLTISIRLTKKGEYIRYDPWWD